VLDTQVIELKRIIDSSFEYIEDRKKILALAVSIAVARTMQIPTSIVENVNQYFNSTLINEVNSKVYKINEQIVFDTDLAISNCRAYWMVRYYTVYPDSLEVIVSEDFDFYCKLAGVDKFIPVDQYKYANDNKLVLSQIVNKLKNII
jgi:hypothetical protein